MLIEIGEGLLSRLAPTLTPTPADSYSDSSIIDTPFSMNIQTNKNNGATSEISVFFYAVFDNNGLFKDLVGFGFILTLS